MIHVSRSRSGQGHDHYVLEPDTPHTRAMLDSVLSNTRRGELAKLAEQRTGFGNSDGGFGLVYPGDLDDFDRENSPIRDGFVQVYGFWGPPEGYEHDIPETEYLEFLAAFLRANDMDDDARRVNAVRASLGGPAVP